MVVPKTRDPRFKSHLRHFKVRLDISLKIKFDSVFSVMVFSLQNMFYGKWDEKGLSARAETVSKYKTRLGMVSFIFVYNCLENF